MSFFRRFIQRFLRREKPVSLFTLPPFELQPALPTNTIRWVPARLHFERWTGDGWEPLGTFCTYCRAPVKAGMGVCDECYDRGIDYATGRDRSR